MIGGSPLAVLAAGAVIVEQLIILYSGGGYPMFIQMRVTL